MFAKLLPFELNLQLRQIGFLVIASIMLVFGLLLMGTDFVSIGAPSGSRIKANGALPLSGIIGFFSITSIFFGSVFVVTGMMRDDIHKSLEIVHATPITTLSMTLARMTGVYMATFLSMFAGVVGLFLGQFSPFADAETMGPINLWHYLYPIIFYLGINALIVSALFTLVAAITRSRMLVYVSAIGIFVLYLLVDTAVTLTDSETAATFLDPFGGGSAQQITEFWSPDELNTKTIPLLSGFGINRILWLSIAIGLLATCMRLFRRGLFTRKTKLGNIVDLNDETDIEIFIPQNGSSTGSLLPAWTRFKHEYLTTIKSVSFIILSGIAVIIFTVNILLGTEFSNNPVLPTNLSIIQLALGSATVPLVIMIIFYSGEIIWRDRTNKVTEILDATPVSNSAMLTGKWFALFAVLLTLISLAILVGIISQLALGDVPVNVMTHALVTFGGFTPNFLMLSALALFVQNFMPNRIIGMVASAGVLIGLVLIAALLPFFHPLMGFGLVDAGGFSEMSGFRRFGRYMWFLLYFSGLVLLFGTVSIWLWRRGLQTSLLKRLRHIKTQIRPITLGLTGIGLLSFLGAGATIYKSINIDNRYETRSAREQRQVDFELALGSKLNDPLPKVRAVKVDGDFFPSNRTAKFAGSYEVENTTGKPLETFFMTMPDDGEDAVLQLDVSGASLIKDPEHADVLKLADIRQYRFETPLPPSGMFAIEFETFIAAPTLGSGGPVLQNGTFVNNGQVLPQIGLPDNRLQNPNRRRRNQLGEIERAPEREDEAARQTNFITPNADYVSFEAKLCTAAGQIPIAPGKLGRVYEEGDRSCREYRAIEPILHFFSFMSADYDVKEDIWTNPNGPDVELRIFYDAQHDYNVDLMMQAAKLSLDTYTELFSPYQYSQIRIMEFPYQNFAQAFAGTIPFSERIGFVQHPGEEDDPASIDFASYVTMHEIGHQWFAHQIIGAGTKGFNVLSEGLTENAAMTAYERRFGWQRTKRLLERRSINNYLANRALDPDKEPPLALAENQQYLVYNKANWVFWGLKQYIGEEAMQGAIRDFLEEHGRKRPPYATTLELIEYLREAAGPDYQQLITDYWDRLTFWDMKFTPEETSLTRNDDGTYKAEFILELDKRIASEETGREVSVLEAEYAKLEDGDDTEEGKSKQEAPKGELLREAEALNEWIEIGFYDKDPGETFGDEWLKLERVHITKAETNLSFEMDTEPAYIVLDPRRLLIERNVDDNEVSVTLDEES